MCKCEEMKALILNHKQKDHTKLRQDKRSTEMSVLSRFYREALKREKQSEEARAEGVIATPEQLKSQASAPTPAEKEALN